MEQKIQDIYLDLEKEEAPEFKLHILEWTEEFQKRNSFSFLQ